MRVRRLIIVVVLASTPLACSRSPHEAEPKPAAAPPAPPPPPAPSPEPPKPAEPVVVESLPPLRVVTGDGITLTETAGHRIRLQTTALWNEPIDTTYDDCEYFRGALPVLRRQIASERVKLLDAMCPEPAPAAKAGAKPKKRASAKPAH